MAAYAPLWANPRFGGLGDEHWRWVLTAFDSPGVSPTIPITPDDVFGMDSQASTIR